MVKVYILGWGINENHAHQRLVKMLPLEVLVWDFAVEVVLVFFFHNLVAMNSFRNLPLKVINMK